MNRKVTVVGGAGNVGATVARGVADKQLADGQRRATAFVPRPEPGGLVEPKVTGTGFFVGNDGYVAAGNFGSFNIDLTSLASLAAE